MENYSSSGEVAHNPETFENWPAVEVAHNPATYDDESSRELARTPVTCEDGLTSKFSRIFQLQLYCEQILDCTSYFQSATLTFWGNESRNLTLEERTISHH